MSIIWPWQAKRAVAEAEERAALLGAEVERLRHLLRDAQARAIIGASDVQKLRRLLDGAHFRNPKTGRLGKKGESFDGRR